MHSYRERYINMVYSPFLANFENDTQRVMYISMSDYFSSLPLRYIWYDNIISGVNHCLYRCHTGFQYTYLSRFKSYSCVPLNRME